MKNPIGSIPEKFGLKVIKSRRFADIKKKANAYDEWNPERDWTLLSRMPIETACQISKLLKKSKSQIRQDLFVLAESNLKKNGFFVEFGATNGIDLSNSYLLEKEFQWKGILAEPAKCWHDQLKDNRSAHIETDCVWKTTGSSLSFNEVTAPELSTVKDFNDTDFHSKSREKGKTYEVKTISLNDLLEKHQAPNIIDYLSIDTEGSEFEILSRLDFNKFTFRIITCEHNFTEMRNKIHALLTSHGYTRKHEDLSMFDDWYVLHK